MKQRYLLFLLTFGLFNTVYSQVGINTHTPKATLEIVKSSSTSTTPSGILIPRLTSSDVQTLTPDLTSYQNSLLIYLTEGIAITTGAYVNMDAKGYYYYDQPNNVWLKFLDTINEPTGLERDYNGVEFGWRYIGREQDNYGVIGKYATDLQYIPKDLTTENVAVPVFGTLNYAQIAAANTSITSTTNFGALGKGAFVSGALNVGSGGFSTTMGAANVNSGFGAFSAGAINSATSQYATSIGFSNKATNEVSIAIGNSNSSTGKSSVALGLNNKSTNNFAATIGLGNRASGIAAIALGENNISSGNKAITFGASNNAAGENSVALGQSNKTFSGPSIVMGNTSEAIGLESIVLGHLSKGFATYSQAIGTNVESYSVSSITMGRFNTEENSPSSTNYSINNSRLFLVGNGMNSSAKSDAFTILRNGKIGIGIDNFENTTHEAKLQVNGNTKTQGFYAEIKSANTIGANDYTVILTGDVVLPDASSNKGRILVLSSDGGSRTITGSLKDAGGTYSSFEVNSTKGTRSITIQSTGSEWWILSAD